MQSEIRRVKKSSKKLYEFDREIASERNCTLVGIDEVGRGPLAGPVVAAAVCLDPEKPVEGVDDSKKLSSGTREKLYERIVADARGWAVASASPQEIDKCNILQATFLAMRRALDMLSCTWDLALVDGNLMLPYLASGRQKTVVGGDALSGSIAAASIIAKVTRDRMMVAYHETYPVYDFFSNKGYGTEHHRSSIESHGLCEIHRRSFCSILAMQTRLPL